MPDSSAGTVLERRARLLERTDDGFVADVDGFTKPQLIPRQRIRARVVLPWKPSDLRDHLFIFRRRNAEEDEYVDDLRARRSFVRNLLQLLTLLETWRLDEEPGPMHQYYTGFDTRTEDEICEIFPEDDVPVWVTLRVCR